MNIVRIIPISLALTCSFYCLEASGQTPKQEDSTERIKALMENHYYPLRQKAFLQTPKTLGIDMPDSLKVYGAVMDWGFSKGSSTLVSFLSGDASIYFSSGSMVIGGFKHERVRVAAVDFVLKANKYLAKATKAETAPIPRANNVSIYLLTRDGAYVITEQLDRLKNNTSEWGDLFNTGNNVITELRMASDKK